MNLPSAPVRTGRSNPFKIMRTIALIEDDPDERIFIQRAIKRSHHPVEVLDFSDGQRALDELEKLSDEDTFPSLVIIDLKLPRIDGMEVLRRLRPHSQKHLVPLIVCSGSSAKSDIITAWQEGCSGYFIKPDNPSDYGFLVSSMLDYWFSAQQGKYNMSKVHLNSPK